MAYFVILIVDFLCYVVGVESTNNAYPMCVCIDTTLAMSFGHNMDAELLRFH